MNIETTHLQETGHSPRNGKLAAGLSTIRVRFECRAPRSVLGSLVLIAVVIAGGAAAFAYTAGWFSPQRLTPNKIVDALAPPTGPALGHRRNHAKGICFTGAFEANGAGPRCSTAQVFARGQYPVVGRFNLATADPDAPDATVRVRGMGLQIATPDGQEWRSAMIDPPILCGVDAASLLRAAEGLGEQGPGRDEDLRRRASRDSRPSAPGPRTHRGPAATRRSRSTASTASSSPTVRARSMRCGGRWCRRRNRSPVSPDELAKRGPDFLEHEIAAARQPRAAALDHGGDGRQSGRSDRGPEQGLARRSPHGRGRHAHRGADRAERDGPCRDINFDPTVLPFGMQTSDDPFPAARSAAYARSYDLPYGGGQGLSANRDGRSQE